MCIVVDRKSKMVVSETQTFSIGSYMKLNMIEPKLYINDHWIVLYTILIVCFDRKSNMAVTTVKMLHITLRGKYFKIIFICITTEQFDSKLSKDVPWIVLYTLCVLSVDGKAKTTDSTGFLHTTLWENENKSIRNSKFD